MVSLTRQVFIAFFAVLLGACSTSDGRLGKDPGAGTAATSDARNRVTGTVRNVDPTRRVIELGEPNDSPAQPEPRTQRLSFDADTVVEYRGERYRPEDLEPGDRIEAQIETTDGTSIARTIVVTQDVRSAEGGEDR